MVTTYLILLALLLGAKGFGNDDKVKLPVSPCPQIFKYAPGYARKLVMGKPTYATIKLPKPDSKQAHILMHLQARGVKIEPLLPNTAAIFELRVITSREDLWNEEKPDIHLNLTINPTKTKRIPSPFSIKVNDKEFCKADAFFPSVYGQVTMTLNLTKPVVTYYISSSEYQPIEYD